MQFYYETPNLILKILKADDVNARQVLEFYQNDLELFEKYEPPRLPNYYTPVFQKDVLRYEYNLAMNGQHLRYYVSLKDQPDRIIGTVCFHNIQANYYSRCEVGYKFASEYQHRGLAKEALNYLILALFDEAKLHRVNAWVATDNVPSIRLLQRLGFEEECLCRDFVRLKDGWTDHYQYVLINPFEE